MSTAFPEILDGVSTNETEAVTWVEDIADPATGVDLTTEYNAATSVPLECLMVERINPDGTVEMTTLRRACSTKGRQRAGVETRTIADLVAVYDPQDLTADVSKAYAALVKSAEGFLVMRRGKHLSEAAAANDLVTIYKVQITHRVELQGADNDEYQFKAGVAVLDWWENVPLTSA